MTTKAPLTADTRQRIDLEKDVTMLVPAPLLVQAVIGITRGWAPPTPDGQPAAGIPRPGEFWEAAGGILLGFVTGENGGADYYAIQPLGEEFFLEDVAIGCSGTDVPKFWRDGEAGTRAFAAAGSKLAQRALEMGCHIPSAHEAHLQITYAPHAFLRLHRGPGHPVCRATAGIQGPQHHPELVEACLVPEM